MAKQKYKPKVGTIITITVDRRKRKTIIDSDRVQRFVSNKLITHLVASQQINLNRLNDDFEKGLFELSEIKNFYMDRGYSVIGFEEIFGINGNLPVKLQAKINNPLWD